MSDTLIINGVNEPARVVFTWPVVPQGADLPYLGVRLEYTGMQASWAIDERIDRSAFTEFFKQVASRREQTVEGLSVHSLDSDLTISADDGYPHPRCIDLTFELSCDTQDPYWTTRLRVYVSKDQLDNLAAEAETFFAAVGAG